ncbi:MAG: alpha/beta fold hydrolase [Pseudomonadota bacterium]
MSRALLLHAFASDRMSWAGTVPALSGLKVETPDLPGHGKALDTVGDGSLEALTKPIRNRLQSGDPAWIVGHSLGGAVALKLAADHPDQVKGLVLIAPLGLGEALDTDMLMAMAEIDTVDAMRRFLNRLVADPSLIAPAIADYALGQLQRDGAREALAKVAGQLAAMRDEVIGLLPAVRATGLPVKVLWGSEDHLVSPDPVRASFFGPVTMIEGAGHIAHIEAARQVNRLLKDTLIS